jgi:transcriptional regulator with AAA-type ATPase domain/tetratricopeptide (TPR) repeat protein
MERHGDEADLPREENDEEFATQWLTSAATFVLPAYVAHLEPGVSPGTPSHDALETALERVARASRNGLGPRTAALAVRAFRAWRAAPKARQRDELTPLVLIPEILYGTGRFRRSLHFCDTLERWGLKRNDPAAVAAASLARGDCLLVHGDNHRALAEFRKARHLCEGDLNSRRYQALCAITEAVAWRKLGDLGMAKARLAHGIDDAVFAAHLRLTAKDRPSRDIPELVTVSGGVFALGLVLMVAGELKPALSAFEVSIRLANFLGDDLRCVTYLVAQIECRMRMGLSCDVSSLDRFEGGDVLPFRLRGTAWRMRGGSLHEEGKHSEALRAYRKALQSYRSMESSVDCLRTHCGLCDLWISRGDVRRAERHLDRARSLDSGATEHETRLVMNRLAAEVAWLRGERDGGFERMLAHRGAAAEAGCGYEAFRCTLRAADMARALGRTEEAGRLWNLAEEEAVRQGSEAFLSRFAGSRPTRRVPHPRPVPMAAGRPVVHDLLTQGMPEVDLTAFGIVSRSTRVLDQVSLIAKLAPTALPVVIRGESGTGKELFARLVHALSRRRKGPFVAVNCAALPPQIMESELFGHRKGAFTGAVDDKRGLFQYADGGTLFLDEIADMSAPLQAKILRALESGEVRRVGSGETERVNVRFVAATHQNLEERIREGAFRGDLYYRLRGLELTIPALRERSEDIPSLAAFFLERVNRDMGTHLRFHGDVEPMMLSRPWPGNVRELRYDIERAAALAGPHGPIMPHHFGYTTTRAPAERALGDHLHAVERARILSALETTGWNQAEAARRLGLRRTTLGAKIRRLGLTRTDRG